MKNLLKKILGFSQRENREAYFSREKEDIRKELEHKVEKGTKRAIEEYREVLEKLAKYDRT